MIPEGIDTVQAKRRLAVVDIRQRVEQVAVSAVRNSFPDASPLVETNDIRKKLAFLVVAYGQEDVSVEILGLTRMARHIYKRTSDVLHGRSSMVNLPETLIDEWSAVVSRLEQLERVERHGRDGLPSAVDPDA